MQTPPSIDPGPASLTAIDCEHRLARFLTHAVKTGATPADCKRALFALEVPPTHPSAATVVLRRPHALRAELVYVDTARLPCDHGRRA